jgi:hypothetical protein
VQGFGKEIVVCVCVFAYNVMQCRCLIFSNILLDTSLLNTLSVCHVFSTCPGDILTQTLRPRCCRKRNNHAALIKRQISYTVSQSGRRNLKFHCCQDLESDYRSASLKILLREICTTVASYRLLQSLKKE